MNCFKLLSIVAFAVFLQACASVRPEYPLPSQALDAPAADEKTKVIFYNGNGFNPLFLDGSWRIGIKLDGVGVENLHLHKYVQVFLKPGPYKLELSHIDLFTFRDEYDFDVTSKTMFVEVYNTLIGNDYETQKVKPDDFINDYEPANNSIQLTAKAAAD
jgi:hypothetical protein